MLALNDYSLFVKAAPTYLTPSIFLDLSLHDVHFPFFYSHETRDKDDCP